MCEAGMCKGGEGRGGDEVKNMIFWLKILLQR